MSAIYKAGQGYWVRLMSAYGLGAIIALGLVWLWKEMEGVMLFGFEPTYVRVVVMLITAVVFAWFGWMIIGTRRQLRHHASHIHISRARWRFIVADIFLVSVAKSAGFTTSPATHLTSFKQCAGVPVPRRKLRHNACANQLSS